MAEVRLPQFGMGMSEARIVQWFKAVGDDVREGEALLEVESAKTTIEVPSPVAGRVTRLLAEAGDIVEVYAAIAVIGDMDEPARAGTAAPPSAPGGAHPHEAPARISPRLRRLAAEQGVDLAVVAGSGPAGRIEERDVLAAAARPAAAAPLAAADTGGSRRVIARRMRGSLADTAQFTLTRTIDMTALRPLRAGDGPGPRTSPTAIVARATALALRAHPRLNAVLEADRLRCIDGIDIGIAVALEDGLVVPVVRAADELPLADLAEAIRQRVRAARDRTLPPDLLTGSTFTITSLGGFGIDMFTPILNPPEVAILGIGTIRERFAREGASGAWRDELTLSLTVDHAAIDGAPAARFLAAVAELCASPDRLL